MQQDDASAQGELAPTFALGSLVILVVTMAAGGAVGFVALPSWLPGITNSLRGEIPHAPWYLCRATGIVAFVLLWASCCLGLVLSARLARDHGVHPAVLDLHQHLALTALAFAALHATSLVFDRYIGLSAFEIVFAFSATRYKPVWTGLGQLAFYCALLGTIAFYARKDLGKVTWRTLHWVSYSAFFVALLHGLGAGSDATVPGLRITYAVAAGSVLLLTFYRLLAPATAQQTDSAP